MELNRALCDSLGALLRTIAQQELLPRFEAGVEGRAKADGSLVTEADGASQARIIDELRRCYPTIALLGEEMSEEQQRSLLENSAEGLWLLDPLDGTSNFAAGIPYFSLSLALMRGGEVVMGLILDPLRDECFSAIKGQGAWLNTEPLRAPSARRPLSQGIALIDLKRLAPKLAGHVVSSPPYSSQRNLGSGALDWCYVASGRVDVYLHGGQKLWDYAAGQLILAEAGGHASTLDGEPVPQRALTPRSVVAAADGGHYRQWRSFLAAG